MRSVSAKVASVFLIVLGCGPSMPREDIVIKTITELERVAAVLEALDPSSTLDQMADALLPHSSEIRTLNAAWAEHGELVGVQWKPFFDGLGDRLGTAAWRILLRSRAARRAGWAETTPRTCD